MDERARKRKLEEVEESDIEGVEKEKPLQGLKEKKVKKQRVLNNADAPRVSGEKPGQ